MLILVHFSFWFHHKLLDIDNAVKGSLDHQIFLLRLIMFYGIKFMQIKKAKKKNNDIIFLQFSIFFHFKKSKWHIDFKIDKIQKKKPDKKQNGIY